jgi:hypothetical protein
MRGGKCGSGKAKEQKMKVTEIVLQLLYDILPISEARD